MQKQGPQLMESLVDKLCDHLPAQRIKLLIDNGFDEWETVTYLKGEQLIDLGFDCQQCIVIMVAINSNCKENSLDEVFGEQMMQDVIQAAKQKDQQRLAEALKEQQSLKEEKRQKQIASMKSIKSSHQIKEYPKKQISEGLLAKGTSMKMKTGQQLNFSKVTMISLQEKDITHLTNLEKVPNIVNLHLGNNKIYKMQNLEALTKVKVLKLQHNNISKIEGLDNMNELQRIFLSNNYISCLQNLTKQPRLRQIFISRQKTDNFSFDPETTSALSYTLQKLQCNQSHVRNITALKYLTVVRQVYLANNKLEDIGELSETLGSMESLKIISFKDNPLAKAQKYRDYIVILSKTVEELDGKKILEKQREYLVKLYALKHAKQNREEDGQEPKKKQNNINLQGTKLEEDYFTRANINRATDLRGNAPHANTKHTRK